MILIVCKILDMNPQSNAPHTIFLLNNNDVDSTAEGCRVQRVVGIPHGAKS